MSKNWMRHFELQLNSSKNGESISLSDLRVTFDIERTDNRWPATATVKIYNLSPQTQNRIMGREFDRITIIAGYDGIAPEYKESDIGVAKEISESQVGQTDGMNFGTLFMGDVRYTVTGKENVTDSFLTIQACDGMEAFMNAFVSTTIRKGYTIGDIYEVLMVELATHGIGRGIAPNFPSTVYPRGRSLYGQVTEYLDEIAAQCNATWQFNNGIVNMTPRYVAAHDVVVVNANTGLVGMPQQTIGGGVNAKCLINSRIRLNGLIRLDQSSVYRAQLSTEQVKTAGEIITETVNGNVVTSGLAQKEQPASIATDGDYIVRYIRHWGDTRGQAWYMEMACEARGSADLLSNSYLLKQDS